MKLDFPTYNFKVKRQENTNYVFDIIRKKYVIITPEEWVRQHLIHCLTGEKGFPASLLAVERGLNINGLQKRFDLLVFNRSGTPTLLVECKSPDTKLDDQVALQIAVYNSRFGCPYLLVSNGIRHLTAHYTEGGTTWLPGIPDAGILG